MTQSTAVATQAEAGPVAKFKAGLERMRPQFSASLPSHISAERFERVALTAVNLNPALMDADRRSLFNALARCAQDGLLPDGREAALVIFGGQAQYMPMVYGIIKKVRQSGDVVEFRSRVVYEKDTFRYTLGDEEKIEHEPFMGDAGKPVAVYAIAKGKEGWIEREVMTVAQVEKVRAVSRAKGNGPWVSWWDEMARKTVMRRLSKRLPISAELLSALEADDELGPPEGYAAPLRPARPVAVVETDTPTDEADAANRQLDREAGAIINGTGTAEEGDGETGEVTETKPEAPKVGNGWQPQILPPLRQDGNWNAWRADAVEIIDNLPTEALGEATEEMNKIGIPDPVHVQLTKAIAARRKK